MAFTLEELYAMQNGESGPEPGADRSAELTQTDTSAEPEGESSEVAVAEPPSEASTPSPTDCEHADEPNEEEADATDTPAMDEQAARIRELESELQECLAENGVLRDRLSDVDGKDPFEEEMIELLKGEVAQLQTELTQRDQQLLELAHSTEPVAAEPTGEDSEELQKLCTRLEDLLEELEMKDEQLTVLQNQLTSAEDAMQAEQHERRQLEVWVSEIEDRVIARDQEAESSVTELQSRLTQALADRRQAEAMGQSDPDTRVETLQRVVSELRAEKDQLKEELAAEREKVQAANREMDTERVTEQRDESVQISQERAQIARERYELERMQRDMAERRAVEGSDLRIRELRNHLKEVHTQEEQARQERFENSLAGRVARLWRRLDSH